MHNDTTPIDLCMVAVPIDLHTCTGTQRVTHPVWYRPIDLKGNSGGYALDSLMRKRDGFVSIDLRSVASEVDNDSVGA